MFSCRNFVGQAMDTLFEILPSCALLTALEFRYVVLTMWERRKNCGFGVKCRAPALRTVEEKEMLLAKKERAKNKKVPDASAIPEPCAIGLLVSQYSFHHCFC